MPQTSTFTHPIQALGRFSPPRKPLLPGPASRDVYATMVMSCAEELRAALHDGAGEAAALLEQGEARFGHVRRRGLLCSGSHFLLFDRSYRKRNRCLPGDRGTDPLLLLSASFRAKALTLLRPTAGYELLHPGGSMCALRVSTGRTQAQGPLGWKCLPAHWGGVSPAMMEAWGRGWPRGEEGWMDTTACDLR